MNTPANTIGFKTRKQQQEIALQQSVNAVPLNNRQMAFLEVAPEVNRLLSTVIAEYFDMRIKGCLRQGAEGTLNAKLEKIWIKFYDPII